MYYTLALPHYTIPQNIVGMIVCGGNIFHCCVVICIFNIYPWYVDAVIC